MRRSFIEAKNRPSDHGYLCVTVYNFNAPSVCHVYTTSNELSRLTLCPSVVKIIQAKDRSGRAKMLGNNRPRFRGLVASHRSNMLMRIAATVAEKYLRAYNNEANWSFRFNGEQDALSVMLRKHAGCLIDVGANVGDWTLMAHAIDPSRPIHAFEVSPTTFQLLSARLSTVDKCVANNVGLSNKSDELELQYYPDSPDRSTLLRLSDRLRKETERVRVISGDDYIESHGIEKVAYLKIDVEGHEMAVIEGFERSIGCGKIAVIQFEHGPAAVLSRQLLGDFVEYLAARRYEVFRIFPGNCEPLVYDYATSETFAPINYLAIRQ